MPFRGGKNVKYKRKTINGIAIRRKSITDTNKQNNIQDLNLQNSGISIKEVLLLK